MLACSSAEETSAGESRAAVEAGDPGAGSSATADAGGADGPLRITNQCTKTFCAWSTEVRDESNETCRDTCSHMPIPNCGKCTDEDYACEDWEKTTCYEHTFAPSKPLISDAAVDAACNRFFDHLDACKRYLTSASRSDCASLAKTGSAATSAFFDCRSALACDADESACTFPASTLGDDVASSYRAKCGDASFTEDQRTAYNGVGGERTDALVAAAKACVTDNQCDLVGSCLAAWWKLE